MNIEADNITREQIEAASLIAFEQWKVNYFKAYPTSELPPGACLIFNIGFAGGMRYLANLMAEAAK